MGEVPAGIDIKLSEGDEGEVLIRSPYMFSKLYFLCMPEEQVTDRVQVYVRR